MTDGATPPFPPPPGDPDWASPRWNAAGVPIVPPIEPGLWRRGHRIAVRPFNLDALTKASVAVLRLHWRALLVVTFVLALPYSLASAYLTRETFGFFGRLQLNETQSRLPPGYFHDLGLVYALGLLQALVVSPIVSVGVLRTSVGTFAGETPRAWQVARYGLRRLGSALWVGLLMLAVFLAMCLPAGALFALAVRASVWPLAVLLVIGFAFAVVLVSARLALSMAALVVEDLRGTAALRRSWDLSRRFMWKILGNTFVISFLAGLAAGILSMPRTLVTFNGTPSEWPIAGIFTALAGAVVTAPMMAAAAFLYIHCRVVEEGLTNDGLDADLRRQPSAWT
jgi:hypothetical protein